jgi:hypothetical protein
MQPDYIQKQHSLESSTLLSALTASLTQLSHSHSLQLSHHSYLNSENKRLATALQDIKVALIELTKQRPVLKILRRLSCQETLEEIDISEDNVVDLFLELVKQRQSPWNKGVTEGKENDKGEEIKEWKEESSNGCLSVASLIDRYPKCTNCSEHDLHTSTTEASMFPTKRKHEGNNDSSTKKNKDDNVRDVIPDSDASKQPPRFDGDM